MPGWAHRAAYNDEPITLLKKLCQVGHIEQPYNDELKKTLLKTLCQVGHIGQPYNDEPITLLKTFCQVGHIEQPYNDEPIQLKTLCQPGWTHQVAIQR